MQPTRPGKDAMELLMRARELGASDLLLVAGAPASVYVHAQLQTLGEELLTPDATHRLIHQMLDQTQADRLTTHRDVDFSLGHSSFGRCRVNAHFQRGSLAAAIRFVSDELPQFEQLRLPPILRDMASYPRGLILVTGPTGSGKSTTLAAMLNEINQNKPQHIITLEDPIEYAFTNYQCVIEQREIGLDSPSFAEALRHVVRQKPDVIMIGEIRDLETIRTALTAAETGHLVLASLHTINASQTVERIIDVFDSTQQMQIRIQLAGSLRAIASQTLFSRADGTGVIPAVEILINTPAVARAIRDGETHLIPGMIETGMSSGMQTLDRQILELVREGLVEKSSALAKAIDPLRLERLLSRDFSGNMSETAGAR